jgi:RNA polymerase sigma-70 factor (ECF subfamily)
MRELMSRSRQGCASALGELLEQCRDYLLFVANQEFDNDLRALVGPSDLVQETFVHAQQQFAAFRGTSESELIGWLRAILLSRELAAYRRYRTAAKRRVVRQSLLHEPASADELARHAVADAPSPSSIAGLAEETAILEQALRRLPADYERVVRLRYWEDLTFPQIGQQMGRSAEAARKLWFRAVELLGEILENGDGDSR